MPSYDFVAIDFETANHNLNSACSMGLAAVRNMEIVDTEYFLIKPPSLYFDENNIKIHGITPNSVVDAPLFPKVWKKTQRYFVNNIVVAHNAHFDMSVLKCGFIEHELDIPYFNYLCSIQISNFACQGKKVGISLMDRAWHFGIAMDEHHNALSDAKTCAHIVIESVKKTGDITFHSFCERYNDLPLKNFTELKPQKYFGPRYRRFQRIAISEIAATVESFERSHPFYGKNIVFTGDLQSMDRRTAMQNVVNLGGVVKSNVSRKTDIVIVGIQDKAFVGPEGISLKEKRAYELIKKGYAIEIIKEENFLGLLNL